jgi:hypothetical protein
MLPLAVSNRKIQTYSHILHLHLSNTMIGHVFKANSKAVVALGLMFLAFSVVFAQEETTGTFSWQKALLTSDPEL